MKKDFIFSYSMMALSLLIGCSGNTQDSKITKKRTNLAKTEASVGYIDQKTLSCAPYASWFVPKYSAYKTKMEYFDLAKTQVQINDIKQYDIEIFLGTWCSDSQREVPRFLKTLNELNYPQEKLKMFTVDRINGKLENKEYNERAKNSKKYLLLFFTKTPRRRDVSWNHPAHLDSKAISY